MPLATKEFLLTQEGVSTKKRSASEKFLYKFTEEILISLKKIEAEKEYWKKEEERIKREIEAEKLRKKYASFKKQDKETQETEKRGQIQQIHRPLQQQFRIPQQIHRQIQQPQTQQIPQIKQLIQQKQKIPVKKLVSTITQINITHKMASPIIGPGEINFGKMIFLVRDPAVNYIECLGEGKNILIRKGNNVFSIQTTLTKEEIKAIVNDFSEKARIPLIEGLLNARISNLEISASLSDVAESSFIIRKSALPPVLLNAGAIPGNFNNPNNRASAFPPIRIKQIQSNEEFQKSIMHPGS